MVSETENPYEPPESELANQEAVIDIVSYRKQLIPKWIEVFGWLFIVAGVLVPIMSIFSAATGIEGSFSLFGLESTGSALSPIALLVFFLFIVLGISAYGLLFGKSWGVSACLVTGYLGLIVVLFTTFMGLSAGVISIRLEPLIQIPYLIKLHKIRSAWNDV